MNKRFAKMRFGFVIPLIATCLWTGCQSPSPIQQVQIDNSNDMLAFLMEGYSREYPNLYCDGLLYSEDSRLRRLIDALGFTNFHYQGSVKGNGDELWVTKGIRDREKPYDEVLILSATKPPLVKKIFHNTIYNDFGREIGTTYEDQNKQKHIQFKNGKELIAPGPFRLDTTGSYLCMGGDLCRPPQGDMRYEPVRVHSLDSLDTPMYFSSLIKYPDEMLYVDDTIILISKSQSPSAGLEVECTQKQNDNRWSITDHYVIRPPAIYAVDFMQMRKFDPATRNMVVFVKQDWPLYGKVYFYDYSQKKLIRGYFLNQKALYFLNPIVLSNSVKYMVQK